MDFAGTKFNYDITIDLHGKSLEDAILELERVIFSGLYRSVAIIHGVGDGRLKSGLREYLINSFYVDEVLFGEVENILGGSGVTIIYI